MIFSIFIWFILLVFSCIIIWRSAKDFEVASDFLGRKFTLGVKGATINAIASSMPEFLSSLFFLFLLRDFRGFSATLGITAGSAIFNLLIIPGLVILVVRLKQPRESILVSRRVLLRDGLFYVFAILVLLFIVDRNIKLWHGALLVGVYLVYLLYLFISIRKNKYFESSEEFHGIKDSVIHDRFMQHLVRLNIKEIIIGNKDLNRINAWILLVVSTTVMAVGTLLLVYATESISTELDVPIIFIALILAAAASSVPDTVISIRDARKGNYDDAISNALGSNIFDISFAIGLPLLLYTLFYKQIIATDDLNLEISLDLWVILLFTSIIALVIFLLGRKMKTWKSITCIAIYVIFLLFILGQAVENSFLMTISHYIFEVVEKIKP